MDKLKYDKDVNIYNKEYIYTIYTELSYFLKSSKLY